MIGKKVNNPRKSATKQARVSSLGSYMDEPERDSREKCIYRGAGGFYSDDRVTQRGEMIELATGAPRSKDPINHYVLSWPEGEKPTPQQCDHAVKMLLEELGLKGHQVIYALHSDTDNLHLHVMVNRVDSVTERPVEINKGFDIEALHRAIARIEHEQGWAREVNGRYAVQEDQVIARVDSAERGPQPSQKASDMELSTGQKSAQRVGIETVPKIVKEATGWENLHQRLASVGIRYEKKGSGALLYVGDQPIKASTADRNASLAKLEGRFGPYKPSAPEVAIAKREIEPLRPESVLRGWADYQNASKNNRDSRNAVWGQWRQETETERKKLADKQRQERKEALGGVWQGKGMQLNVMRSVLAAKHAREKAGLKDSQVRERGKLRIQYPPFPYYEKWLAQERHMDQLDNTPSSEGPAQPATTKDIRDFVHSIHGTEVRYRRRNRRAATVAFVDEGQRIAIYDWRSQDSLLAALQLSQAKWGGGFTVTGNAEYKAACVRVAAEHGFRILNPELQQALENERVRTKTPHPHRLGHSSRTLSKTTKKSRYSSRDDATPGL